MSQDHELWSEKKKPKKHVVTSLQCAKERSDPLAAVVQLIARVYLSMFVCLDRSAETYTKEIKERSSSRQTD